METKHTPGPWKRLEIAGRPGTLITQHSSTTASSYVASVNYAGSTDATEANARLIAAAPELLEALKLTSELINNSDVRHFISHKLGEQSSLHAAINKARAAISKATA